MLDSPACPVCGTTGWSLVGEKTYDQKDLPKLTEYVKIRYDVLFNIWAPGRDKIEIKCVGCNNCGFVFYTPRPSEEDISNKYVFLASHPVAKNEYGRDLKGDAERSQILFDTVQKHLGTGPKKVLDFGGGNGRLMPRFVEAGHLCHLLDFADDTVPGVTKIGSTFDDVPADAQFDLVVCSHVLEHLASPLEIAKRLASLVAPGGILYIEVPCEVWGRSPLGYEPVTHVNFFTPESLRCLMQQTGLSLVRCDLGSYVNPNGDSGMAIKAIARNDSQPVDEVIYGGFAPTAALLRKSLVDDIAFSIRHPRLVSKTMRNIGKRLPIVWRYV